MHIYGEYVLSLIFGTMQPDSVSVESLETINAELIRDSFQLPKKTALRISATVDRRKSLNVDFWAVLPNGKLVSLDSAHPISTTLYTVRDDLNGEDWVRYLSFAVQYPWDDISPPLSTAIRCAVKFSDTDLELAELLAIRHCNCSFDQLIELAEQQLRRRDHDS